MDINLVFHHHLRQFFWGSLASAYIKVLQYGWNDGGCLLLAEAVLQWIRGEVLQETSYEADLMIIEGERGGVLVADHVVVAVRAGAGSESRYLYIDADGISEEAKLLERWTAEERLLHPRLTAFDVQRRVLAAIPRHPEISRALALELREQFGAFSPDMLLITGKEGSSQLRARVLSKRKKV